MDNRKRKSCIQILSSSKDGLLDLNQNKTFNLTIKDPQIDLFEEKYFIYFGQISLCLLIPCLNDNEENDMCILTDSITEKIEIGIENLDKINNDYFVGKRYYINN